MWQTTTCTGCLKQRSKITENPHLHAINSTPWPHRRRTRTRPKTPRSDTLLKKRFVLLICLKMPPYIPKNTQKNTLRLYELLNFRTKPWSHASKCAEPGEKHGCDVISTLHYQDMVWLWREKVVARIHYRYTLVAIKVIVVGQSSY